MMKTEAAAVTTRTRVQRQLPAHAPPSGRRSSGGDVIGSRPPRLPLTPRPTLYPSTPPRKWPRR